MTYLASYSYQVGNTQGVGDAYIDFEIEEPLTKVLVEKIRAAVVQRVSTHKKASVVIVNLIRLEVAF